MVDGLNLYRYARNNPSTISDPNGQQPPDPRLHQTIEDVIIGDGVGEDIPDPRKFENSEDFIAAAPDFYSIEYLQEIYQRGQSALKEQESASEQDSDSIQEDLSDTAVETDASSNVVEIVSQLSDEETRLWAEAEIADYNLDTTQALLDYYADNGSVWDRKTALNRATVFATSGSRAFDRGDPFEGSWYYFWASVDSIGYTILGDNATETAGNVAKGIVLGALFNRLFSAARASAAAMSASRVAILERVLTSQGTLNTSATVARQLAGPRSYIPVQSILDAIAVGARRVDPQGVAGQYMYVARAAYNGSKGTLEVLVHEASGQIRHVLFRSQ